MHCDVATNIRRLPRFFTVPCTFVVAGIFMQIIAVVSVKMNCYFEHPLTRKLWGCLFCIAGNWGMCGFTLLTHARNCSFYPQNRDEWMQVRKVMESVIFQISDTGTQLIFCICAMWAVFRCGWTLAPQFLASIFSYSVIAPFHFLLKFELISTRQFTLWNHFCAGFSGDLKDKLKSITGLECAYLG